MCIDAGAGGVGIQDSMADYTVPCSYRPTWD